VPLEEVRPKKKEEEKLQEFRVIHTTTKKLKISDKNQRRHCAPPKETRLKPRGKYKHSRKKRSFKEKLINIMIKIIIYNT
jgi:hypothetical protein